jgi:uncharacterized protein YqiB (DUF1249 family)
LYYARKIKHQTRYQVDLSALMAVCETNYWRLRKLLLPIFPEFKRGAEFYFAIPSAEGERHLLLRVLERCTYTTTLDFVEVDDSERLSDKHRWGLSPQLTVRIYHDAKTSEVIAFQGQRHFLGRYAYPNPLMRQRDEKLQLNNLLADWLNHCLYYGCPVSRPA